MDTKFDFSKKDLAQTKEYVTEFVKEAIDLFSSGKDKELKAFINSFTANAPKPGVTSGIDQNPGYYAGMCNGIYIMLMSIYGQSEDYQHFYEASIAYDWLVDLMKCIYENGMISHGDAAKIMSQSDSNLSNKLDNEWLSDLAIVNVRKIGRKTVYSLTPKGRSYYMIISNKEKLEYGKDIFTDLVNNFIK